MGWLAVMTAEKTKKCYSWRQKATVSFWYIGFLHTKIWAAILGLIFLGSFCRLNDPFCADTSRGNSRGGTLEFLLDSDALCDVHLKAVLLPSSIPFTTWSFFCFSRSLNNKRWLHITRPTDFNPAVPYSLVITVVLIYFFNRKMNKLQSSYIGVALFNYVPIGYGNLLNKLLHAKHYCL